MLKPHFNQVTKLLDAKQDEETNIYAGDKCVVTEDTPIANNLENYKLTAKAIIVGDQDKLAELIAQGQCSMIRKGVRVLALEQPEDAAVGEIINIR